MVRYTGNDDPPAAEGFNGLRTNDMIIRKTEPTWAHKTHDKGRTYLLFNVP